MFYLHKMQFVREKFDLSIDYKCQIIHETLYSLLLFNLSKIVDTVENQSCFTFPDHMVFVTVQKVAFYCRKFFGHYIFSMRVKHKRMKKTPFICLFALLGKAEKDTIEIKTYSYDLLHSY